ncbi:hypothetical protein J5N97_025079 [Dioscorea zingiberensis]|uniref:Chorein N-terminal domain-containing protein n=1 Tax=Dioscorea zingiberensis TaxID=325984 RepID=A0A9D5H9H5_9LILI|nr:hypothetical protein J5N97_025079 [Dioscorea zingiberensis]
MVGRAGDRPAEHAADALVALVVRRRGAAAGSSGRRCGDASTPNGARSEPDGNSFWITSEYISPSLSLGEVVGLFLDVHISLRLLHNLEGEILLEKVELILEAFDYLQLPFTLKNGRVGKWSIRIPWKKLVEFGIYQKRELAGKIAKLNAVELAKFSKSVSGDPSSLRS